MAIPFGFKLYPLHVLAGLLLLGVFGVGMGAFSNALAIASRKREWMFWAVQQSLLFPLLILSGMMLPLGGRAAVDPGARQVQPADLHRGRRAGAVLRHIRRSGDRWAVLAAVITCAAGLWVGVKQVARSTT